MTTATRSSYALSDLVRHLRQDDEVFVVGFGKDLEFEQDLTRNDKLLEEAIANIKPQSGAALLDAVAFAAGHLDRIAKNRSRVLLVISDGHDAAAHISSSEMNGVLGKCGLIASGSMSTTTKASTCCSHWRRTQAARPRLPAARSSSGKLPGSSPRAWGLSSRISRLLPPARFW